MTKILHQSTTELERHPIYVETVRRRLMAAASSGTEIIVRGLPAGTWGGLSPSKDMSSPYVYMKALASEMFASVTGAERDGYDAVILASYTEPFLRECCSIVDIPVLSAPESAFLVSMPVAPLIGLVTLNAENQWFLKSWVARNGVGARTEGVYVVEPSLDELDLEEIVRKPDAYLDGFIATSRRSIAGGADAIIPAEGIIATLTATAGLTEIDGVSVIDGIAALVAFAEMMVKLRSVSDLHAGRKWHYQKPSDPARSRFPV